MVQVQAKRVGNEHLVHHDYFIARLLFSSSFLCFFLIGGCLRVEGKRISFFSFLWKKVDTFGHVAPDFSYRCYSRIIFNRQRLASNVTIYESTIYRGNLSWGKGPAIKLDRKAH